MRKNPSIFLTSFFIALGALSAPLETQAAETRHFCSMAEGVDQLITLSGLEKQRHQPDIRAWTEQIIEEKLAVSPEGVQITWKDIYDLRGTVNMDACSRGQGFSGFLKNLDSCLGAGIDAVGSGLAGTTAGTVLVALAGPPGWVLIGGMGVTQETFQCTPDLNMMAGEAALTTAFLIPWCKVPGIGTACKAAKLELKKGLVAVAKKVFNPKAVKIISENEAGAVIELTTDKGNIFMQMSAKRTARNPEIVEVTARRMIEPNPLAKKQRIPLPIKTPQAVTGKGPGQSRFNFDGAHGALKTGSATMNDAVVVAQAGGKTAKAGSIPRPKRQEVLLQKYSSLRTEAPPSPTIHAPELFDRSIRATKFGKNVAPESGSFYRGVSKKELERILADGGAIPKAFSNDYKGLPFETYIKKNGADAMVVGHVNGRTTFMTSVSRDMKVADVHAGTDGYVLRFNIKDKRAYSTESFSRFSEKTSKLPEKELLVPGKIDLKDIEVLDRASGKWVPLKTK